MNAFLTQRSIARKALRSCATLNSQRKPNGILRTVVFFALVLILTVAAWAQNEPDYLEAHQVGKAVVAAVKCQ